jgi:hypothetical protein
MPRNAPATGETSGPERYQSPPIGDAPWTPDGQYQIPRAPEPCERAPGSPFRIRRSAPRAAWRTRSRPMGDRSSMERQRSLWSRTKPRTGSCATSRSVRYRNRLSQSPGAARSTTPGVRATVMTWILVSVLGSPSFAPASVTFSACMPGPIAADGTRSWILAAPPGWRRTRRSPTVSLPARTTTPTLSSGAPASARTSSSSPSESPAVTLVGPANAVTARSAWGARGNSLTDARPSSSGGRSPASSISPSVITTTGRSEAAAAVSAGPRSDRPRLGVVSGLATSPPNSRTSPVRRADSRASFHRPPGAPMLSEPSSSTSGRTGPPADGQLTLSRSRPRADQATPRATSGTSPRRPRRSTRR